MKLNIWEIRIDRGVTLIELAKRTGISKSTLGNFENGLTTPNLLQLEKIARALNVHITDLFDSDIK